MWGGKALKRFGGLGEKGSGSGEVLCMLGQSFSNYSPFIYFIIF